MQKYVYFISLLCFTYSLRAMNPDDNYHPKIIGLFTRAINNKEDIKNMPFNCFTCDLRFGIGPQAKLILIAHNRLAHNQENAILLCKIDPQDPIPTESHIYFCSICNKIFGIGQEGQDLLTQHHQQHSLPHY